MKENNCEFIDELHMRNYSIYGNSKEENSALQELHERSYMIFDEEETIRLREDYRTEFSRIAKDVSLVSLSLLAKNADIFIEKFNPVVGIFGKNNPYRKKPLDKSEVTIADIVSMIENFAKTKKA